MPGLVGGRTEASRSTLLPPLTDSAPFPLPGWGLGLPSHPHSQFPPAKCLQAGLLVAGWAGEVVRACGSLWASQRVFQLPRPTPPPSISCELHQGLVLGGSEAACPGNRDRISQTVCLMMSASDVFILSSMTQNEPRDLGALAPRF